MKVFIGWDPRDATAYRVLVGSILRYAKDAVEIVPVKDHELRWRGLYRRAYRVDETGQMWDEGDGRPFSTAFSFTRFCVPLMNDFADEWVIFMDADMMFRADIGGLFRLADRSKAVNVVKHVHKPPEDRKMGGLAQTLYQRKNWSSLMLMNTARCRGLDIDAVNARPGAWLHGMKWVEDDEIGALPEAWNWLEGWSSPDIRPLNVHFTRGTPDMPGCENAAFAREWLEAATNLRHAA
jgi:hypothetical protein